MVNILDCLIRNCFDINGNVASNNNNNNNDDDDDSDDSDDHQQNEEILAPHIFSLNRFRAISSYRPPNAHPPDRDTDIDIDIDMDRDGNGNGGGASEHEQRLPLNSSVWGSTTARHAQGARHFLSTGLTRNHHHHPNNNNTNTNNEETHQISDFFRRVRHNLNQLPNFPTPQPHTPPSHHPIDTGAMMRKVTRSLAASTPSHLPPLPLRPAHYVSQRPSTDHIPSLLQPDQIVLPGSVLQRSMAESLRARGEGGEAVEDECVVCLEGFDRENPRMPTRCGCGVDRTYFHLPCLFQWVELRRDGGGRSGECPSCRELLLWEEFED